MVNKISNGFQSLVNQAKAEIKEFGPKNLVKAQQTTEGKVGECVDGTFTTMENGLKASALQMDTKGVEILGKPVFNNLTVRKLDINENDSSYKKVGKKVANGISTYHTKVLEIGDKVTNVAGQSVHATVRAILSIFVRFPLSLLRLEPLGANIQNAVALAAGFITRIALFAASQVVFQTLPYAIVASAISGAVFGFFILGHISIPLTITAGTIVALAVLQAQICVLFKKDSDKEVALREQKQQISDLKKEMANKKSVADVVFSKKAAKVVGATLAAGAVIGAGVYVHQNGLPNVDNLTDSIKSIIAKLPTTDQIKAFGKTGLNKISAGFNFVGESLGTATKNGIDKTVEIATTAKNTVKNTACSFDVVNNNVSFCA